MIEPTNQSQTTQEKKKGKPGNGQEQPKAAARNKAKTKTKKYSLPLSDPLIRLNRMALRGSSDVDLADHQNQVCRKAHVGKGG